MANKIKVKMLANNTVKSFDKRYADLLVKMRRAVYYHEKPVTQYMTREMITVAEAPVALIAEHLTREMITVTTVDEAPVETEVATVDEAPVETEVATVDEAPVETEVATVAEAPVETEVAVKSTKRGRPKKSENS